VVPVDATVFGEQFTGAAGQRVQTYVQCCHDNIAAPALAKVKALGCDEVIRGQRNDEGHKAPSRNGQVVDGVTFLHPLETWSRDEVLDYLRRHMGELPEHFALEHSSMDCYDCTAYAAHSVDRIEFAGRYPELEAARRARLSELRGVLDAAMSHYDRLGQL
jgi:3'-phosphoadenosine 5'-phosphosulfate sulfotransferase (PAPS reductase)/FAD synthetase